MAVEIKIPRNKIKVLSEFSLGGEGRPPALDISGKRLLPLLLSLPPEAPAQTSLVRGPRRAAPGTRVKGLSELQGLGFRVEGLGFRSHEVLGSA